MDAEFVSVVSELGKRAILLNRVNAVYWLLLSRSRDTTISPVFSLPLLSCSLFLYAQIFRISARLRMVCTRFLASHEHTPWPLPPSSLCRCHRASTMPSSILCRVNITLQTHHVEAQRPSPLPCRPSASRPHPPSRHQALTTAVSYKSKTRHRYPTTPS